VCAGFLLLIRLIATFYFPIFLVPVMAPLILGTSFVVIVITFVSVSVSVSVTTPVLIPNLSGMTIARKIIPGTALRSRVIPVVSSVVIVVIVVIVEFIRIFQHNQGRQRWCNINTDFPPVSGGNDAGPQHHGGYNEQPNCLFHTILQISSGQMP
jgi:hypothetical protein